MELGKKIRTNQGERRVLTRRFHAALKEDRRSRVRRAGEEIKTLVSNDQVERRGAKLNGGTKRPRNTKSHKPVSIWIKPQPCGKNSTGNALQRSKAFQS